MLEIEKAFLAKYIPKGLKDCDSKEIIDQYLKWDERHSPIRIRKNGDKFEITKKSRINDDSAQLLEENIELTEKEFNEISKLATDDVHKIRYYYKYQGKTFEIDVLQGALKGLVIVELEFDSVEEKDSFEMPDFCLVDLPKDGFFAGGDLCGKSYEDFEEILKDYNYKKLFLD